MMLLDSNVEGKKCHTGRDKCIDRLKIAVRVHFVLRWLLRWVGLGSRKRKP